MVSIENLEFLRQEGLDYIVALTHTKARNLIFQKDIQPELFDEKIPVTVWVEEEKKKYVLCGSKYRAEHDRYFLEKLLLKGRAALETVVKMVEEKRLKDPVKIIKRAQKKLTKSNGENFYDFKYENGKFEIIENTSFIEKARALCGYYVLCTTKVDMEDKEVEVHYKQLKFVEDSFKQLKDLVEIRPIFHWKDRRVKTHVFLCILAQTVVNKIRDTLKQKGWLDEEKGNTLAHFLDLLYQINLGVFEIEEVENTIITQLTPEQKKILSLFDLEQRYFTSYNSAKEVCSCRGVKFNAPTISKGFGV